MPRTLQETLSQLSDEVLHDLARAHGFDPARQADRGLLIETLVSLTDSDGLLAEADRRQLEHLLRRLRPRQLREIGQRYRVGLHGLKRKRDLVDALAASPRATEILMEQEAVIPVEHEANAIFGREGDVDFLRVEELLEHARKRFQERRFEAALTSAQEASRIAERTTARLRRASWSYAILAAQGLLEPCDPKDPDTVSARVLLERARESFFRAALGDEALLQALVRASETAHAREAERLRELLALTRDAIREAANLGASVVLAEDVWKRGADFLDRDRLGAARESFVEASRRTEEARRRRVQEVEESVESVADHITLARRIGADMEEAEGIQEAARRAVAAGEHGLAGDLLKRAERMAMKGQQRQIERAIQLRRAQIEKGRAILAACEPVLKEAEAYDLNPTEVRVLLRQAEDVLGKGDYLAGVTLARNAEEASRRLEAQIAEERQRRGITKPVSGMCGVCRSRRVTFQDDGWGRCEDCGNTFRWRGSLAVWERLKNLLAP